MVIWLGAMIIGVGIGTLHIDIVDAVMNVVASVFTRLFRLLVVPTIILAIITTLASLDGGKEIKL